MSLKAFPFFHLFNPFFLNGNLCHFIASWMLFLFTIDANICNKLRKDLFRWKVECLDKILSEFLCFSTSRVVERVIVKKANKHFELMNWIRKQAFLNLSILKSFRECHDRQQKFLLNEITCRSETNFSKILIFVRANFTLNRLRSILRLNFMLHRKLWDSVFFL